MFGVDRALSTVEKNVGAVGFATKRPMDGLNPSPDIGDMKRLRPMPPMFRSMVINIEGLPSGWKARVTTAGTISFVHLESGHEQDVVRHAELN